MHDQDAAIGVQLAHAGRKASTYREWSGHGSVPEAEGVKRELHVHTGEGDTLAVRAPDRMTISLDMMNPSLGCIASIGRACPARQARRGVAGGPGLTCSKRRNRIAMDRDGPRIKLRLEYDVPLVLGPGKAQLLHLIGQHGSISAAGRPSDALFIST